MSREPEKAEAREMRDRGYLLREIGDRFGVSKQTVMRWTDDVYAERARAASRAKKESYRGECVECGKATNGSQGPGTAAERCQPCRARADRLWTRGSVVVAIQRFAERYGRPPAAADFHPAHARARGDDWRAERFEADGDYPGSNSVQKVFGSWSAGITAAGFEAQPVGHYDRTPYAGVGRRRGAHLEADRATLDHPVAEATVESEGAG